MSTKSKESSITWTRLKNDGNGNGRIVCHFLNLLTEEEKERDWGTEYDRIGVSSKYAFAVKRANKIGGKRFHNKQYGGGIVFQASSPSEIEPYIKDLLNNMK